MRTWVKSHDNPVLGAGEPGAFDSWNIHAPMVVHDGTEFKMFYAGGPNEKNGGGTYTSYRLGLATSPDGVRFTKRPEPILPLGERDNFHTCMAVLRDAGGRLLREDGLWKAWFNGNRENDIEYATSRDGVRWERSPLSPVHRGAYAPTVIKEGDTYRMWFTRGPFSAFRILYATSADGIHWTERPDPVLTGERDWEHGSVVYPFVAKREGTYYLWYGGGASSSPPRFWIGEATSPDGIHWTKRPDNPILSPEPGSDWDSVYCGCPCAVPLPDGRWRLYYAGRKDMIHKYFAIGFAEEVESRP